MTTDSEHMKILQAIEDGLMTAAEGIRLLNGLSGGSPNTIEAASEGGTAEAASPESAPIPPTFDPPKFAKPKPDPQIEKWRRWWMMPMWIGVGFILIGAMLMYLALQSSGVGFWFLCASTPFAFGVLMAALAGGSHKSRWIHIRVNTGRNEWPRNIALSFPISTRLLAWLIRAFGDRIPPLRRTAVDDLIVALDQSASAESPLFIEVNEGEGGERVQVYIG